MAVIAIFLIGLSVGSFINVLIYRVPRKQSILAPPSHCPNCETPISWYDNIPLLSYALLKGRCRACKERIPIRYPAVELSGGVLFVAVLFKVLGPTVPQITFRLVVELTAGLFFVSVLLAVTYIDVERQIIPNRIIYPALVLAPVLLVLSDPSKITFYLIGFGLGAGLLLLISLIQPAGMGAGDIKLAAFMGLYLGWQILLALFIGFATGAIIGISLAVARKKGLKEPIAFGPFLALGGLLAYFYGTPLTNLYLRLFF